MNQVLHPHDLRCIYFEKAQYVHGNFEDASKMKKSARKYQNQSHY